MLATPPSRALPHPVQAARALMALLYVEASTVHEAWLKSHRDQYSQNTLDRLDLGALLPARSTCALNASAA